MNPISRCLLSLLGLFGLVGLLAGCSSAPEANYPYTTMTLREIRQAPTGQLALIYDQQKPAPAGQRVYFVDQNTLNRSVAAALEEIKATRGSSESFSGSVVVHRTQAQDAHGQDVFWAELDPYTLPGTWMPLLTEPALTPAALAEALPPSFNAPHLSTQPIDNQSFSSLTPPIIPTRPGQHFIWLTADGPLDASVADHSLFAPHHNDTFSGKVERVVGGTITVVVGTVVVAGVVALELFVNRCPPHDFEFGPHHDHWQ